MLSFENKNELLEKMKQVREDKNTSTKRAKKYLEKILSVAVQQIYYTSNEKLLKFKSYLTKNQKIVTRRKNMIQTIKVLVKEPYKEIEVREIQNNLKAYKQLLVDILNACPFQELKMWI